MSKNYYKQGRNGDARHCTEYWKCTVEVYETIPVDFDFGLETCQEENDNLKDINEQTTLYARCKKNVHDRANRALVEDYHEYIHNYEALKQLYHTAGNTSNYSTGHNPAFST